jgi:hypothetical protein
VNADGWFCGVNRGQYSDAVLNELESQNDQQVDGILGKVRLLKDVSSGYLSRTGGQVPAAVWR